MAARNKARERVMTLVFMLAITVVVVGAVSGAYLATADRIHANASLFLKRAVLKAAGLAVPPESAGVEALYAARIRPEGDPPTAFAVLDAAGAASAGRVLLESGAGLWGPIRAVIGFDGGGEHLTGIEFIAHSETPGLGARIDEDGFKEQFKGKQGLFSRVPEGAPSKESEFDAITGATITSRAVEGILNRSVSKMRK